MPKSDAERSREYRQKKKERNKKDNIIKKNAKSSTERVREFRARRKNNSSNSLVKSTSQQEDIESNITGFLPEAREIIASVFRYLQTEYEQLKSSSDSGCDLSPLSNILKRTAEATGVSEQTVTAVLKEEKRSLDHTYDNAHNKPPKLEHYLEDEDASQTKEESSSGSTDEVKHDDDENAIQMEVVADQQQTLQQSQQNIQSTQTRPYSNAERQKRYREKRKAYKMNACTTFSQSSDDQAQQEQQQHDVQINGRRPLSSAERQRKYRKLLRERRLQQQQMKDINASSSIHQLQNVDPAKHARKRYLNKLRQSRFRARKRFDWHNTSSHQATAKRQDLQAEQVIGTVKVKVESHDEDHSDAVKPTLWLEVQPLSTQKVSSVHQSPSTLVEVKQETENVEELEEQDQIEENEDNEIETLKMEYEIEEEEERKWAEVRSTSSKQDLQAEQVIGPVKVKVDDHDKDHSDAVKPTLWLEVQPLSTQKVSSVHQSPLTLAEVKLKTRNMEEVKDQESNKAPKSSAERGREFRARKALLKQRQGLDATLEDIRSAGLSEDNQVPGPSEIRMIEKRARSAESTRRWRLKKMGICGYSKKQAKTAAQRMREYRERKRMRIEGRDDNERETLKMEFEIEEEEERKWAETKSTSSKIPELLDPSKDSAREDPLALPLCDKTTSVCESPSLRKVKVKVEPSELEYEQSKFAVYHIASDATLNPVKVEPPDDNEEQST